jgi:hypothetical protein
LVLDAVKFAAQHLFPATPPQVGSPVDYYPLRYPRIGFPEDRQ